MSSDEDDLFKDKRRGLKRKRNMIAKSLRDVGDHKGAFALKVIDPRKQEYKRMKMRVNDVDDDEVF